MNTWGQSLSLLKQQWYRDLPARIESLAQWINNHETRRQIASSVLERVRQMITAKKTAPKNLHYWLSRTINGAFRKALDNHGIARPNVLTEDVHKKIRELAARRTPRYLLDAVVRNVFKRLRHHQSDNAER